MIWIQILIINYAYIIHTYRMAIQKQLDYKKFSNEQKNAHKSCTIFS